MEPRRAGTTNITAVLLPRHFDAGPTSTPACQPASLLTSPSANQPTASFNPNAAAAAAAQVLRNEGKETRRRAQNAMLQTYFRLTALLN